MSESAPGKNLSYKVTDKAQIKGIVDGGKLGIMPVGGGEKQQGVIFESQNEAIFIPREAFLGLAERVLNNKVLNKDGRLNKFFGDIELGGVYKVSEKLIEGFKNLSAGEFKEQAQILKKEALNVAPEKSSEDYKKQEVREFKELKSVREAYTGNVPKIRLLILGNLSGRKQMRKLTNCLRNSQVICRILRVFRVTI